MLTVGGDLTLTQQVQPAGVVWPVRVGAIPMLADCYRPRAVAPQLFQAVDTAGTAVLTQVMSGLGGVGKSQLAAAYARSNAGELDMLVWVSASSRDAIQGGYAQGVKRLGHDVEGDGEQAAAWFLAWLETTDRQWLIVLDDLADPADLRGLWPRGPRGRVLVTTRRTDAVLSTHGRRRVDVGLFTSVEARDYLVAKLGTVTAGGCVERIVEAAELAADLGYLPLALAQAAAFVLDHADPGETCARYRTRLADRRRALAELFPDDAGADDYQTTVAATWSISVDAADKLQPRGVARPLLQVLSVLDPHGIPADLITTDAIIDLVSTNPSPHPDPITAVVGETAGLGVSALDCQDALRNLARLSLLTISRDPTSPGGVQRVLVHALVQRASIEHLPPPRLATLVRAGADALLQMWPGIERDLQLSQLLRANAATLAERPGQALWQPDSHELLARAGESLGASGLVTAAAAYWTQLVHEADDVLGPDHPDTLAARHNLAAWRGHAGDPAGAAIATEDLLTDQLRVLDSDHPGTLLTRGNLARWRGEAGDPADAATAFEDLLTDQLRVLGPDHPDTLSTRDNLAHWRDQAGGPHRGRVTQCQASVWGSVCGQ
jgi:hypothetical protein